MIRLEYSERLLFILILLPLMTLFIYDRLKREKLFQWFHTVKRSRIEHLLIRSIHFVTASAAVVLMIIGLSGPFTDKKEIKKQKISGEEILFMVDVSRSMLAQDVVPSRLEKVKLDIEEFVRSHNGSRMGLIAFAGDAVIKCPMTTDSFYLISAVRQLEAGSVARGSTSIASALRKSLTLMPAGENGASSRNIIIFTDGEDHEEDPVEAALSVEKEGGRMLIIAIGNNRTGSRIPVTDESGNTGFLVHEGEEVWSKTDLTTLKKITESCRSCALIPALDGQYDLERHYRSFNLKMGLSAKTESEAEVRFEARYRITPFAVSALLLLLVSYICAEISRRRISLD